MNNYDLCDVNIQELSIKEMAELNGGSQFSESVAYWLGYGMHKLVGMIQASNYPQ